MKDDEQSKLKAKLEVPKDWICQECMPREGSNNLVEDEVEVATRRKEGPNSPRLTDYESSKVSKLRSTGAQLPSNEYQVILVGKSTESSPCEVSLGKQIKKEKTKSMEVVFPAPKRSSGDTLFSRLVIPEVDCIWLYDPISLSSI